MDGDGFGQDQQAGMMRLRSCSSRASCRKTSPAEQWGTASRAHRAAVDEGNVPKRNKRGRCSKIQQIAAFEN
jgi:hypothetical protein